MAHVRDVHGRTLGAIGNRGAVNRYSAVMRLSTPPIDGTESILRRPLARLDACYAPIACIMLLLIKRYRICFLELPTEPVS